MKVDIIWPSQIGRYVLREIAHPLGPTRPDFAGHRFRLSAEALEISVFQTDSGDTDMKFLEKDLHFRQKDRSETDD